MAVFMTLLSMVSLQAETHEVQLTAAGTLRQQLSGVTVSSITGLVISGPLNGSDIKYIREMNKLVTLDMENASIVSGGEAYYENYHTADNQIGDQMFRGYDYGWTAPVTSIILPRNITRIGDTAFEGRDVLNTITLFEGITDIGYGAFWNCSALENITLPSTLKVMGNSVFAYCRKLTSIHIPTSVESIGDIPFNDCTSLKSITVDAANNYYESMNDILFTKGKEQLIKYPAKKTDTSYTLPETVKTIKDEAFSSAIFLSAVQLPSMLREIGTEAFSHTNITSITLPATVQRIGANAFMQCGKLTSLTVAPGNRYFKAINNALYSYDGTRLIVCPTGILNDNPSFTVPSGVTTIAAYAFSNSNLQSIHLPYGLKTIEERAFSSCRLQTLILPATVESIENYAFAWCYEMSSIALPACLQTIGYEFLSGNNQLATIYCPLSEPAASYQNTFYNIPPTCELYVPTGRRTAYQSNSDWNQFSTISEEEIVIYDSQNATVCPSNPEALERLLEPYHENGVYLIETLTLVGNINSNDAVFIGNISKLSRLNLRKATLWKTNDGVREHYLPTGMFAYGESLGTNLQELVLPEKLKYIESNGVDIHNLQHLVSPSTVPTPAAADAFKRNNCTLVVPFGTQATYATATGWNVFSENTDTDIQGAVTLNLTTPGTLSSLINEDARPTVKTLILTGTINKPDFDFLQQLCQEYNLTAIDLSRTNIAAYGQQIANRVPNDAFMNCNTLQTIAFPASATEIGGNVCWSCPMLTTLILPEQLVKLESSFGYCHKLTRVSLPATLQVIEGSLFPQCNGLIAYTVDDNSPYLKAVDGVLFSADGSLIYSYPKGKAGTSYLIPNEVKTIGNNAFNGCRLTSVELGSQVTEIKEYAFINCNQLSAIILNEGLKIINQSAIQSFVISDITLPASLTTINGNPFIGDNPNLTNITVAIGNSAFKTSDGVLFSMDMTRLITYPAGKTGTSYSIPAEVRSIEARAFQYAKLTEITFVSANSPISIGTGAFLGTKITSMVLPEGLNRLEGETFQSCNALTKVVLPGTLTFINYNAFYDCPSLTELHCNATTPPALNSAFHGLNTGACTLYIPVGSKATYTSTTEWNTFARMIEKAVSTLNTTTGTLTVALTEAGTLNELLLEQMGGTAGLEVTLDHTHKLIVRGEVNGTDINNIRHYCIDRAGLTQIDLSKADIRAGGDWYMYDADTKENIYTADHIITPYMFSKLAHLTRIDLPETTTAIEQRAMQDCTALETLTIPDGVSSLGQEALSRCSNLKVVYTYATVPPALVADALSQVPAATATLYVPHGGKNTYSVTEGWKEFGTIKELVYVAVSGTLNEILGNGQETETELILAGNLNGTDIKVLRGMPELTSLDMSRATIVPGGEKYYQDYGTEAYKLGPHMFHDIAAARKLTSIILPENTISIGEECFWNCLQLTSISIPADVTDIKNWAFDQCQSLTSIQLPTSLQTIGGYVFSGCNKLTAIHIPAKVNSMGDRPFQNTPALESITVDPNNEFFLSDEGILFSKNRTELYAYPSAKEGTHYTVPSTVSVLCPGAFQGSNLESVTIPSTVSSLSHNLFNSSHKLAFVSLSEGLAAIEAHAFSSCYSLTGLTIPSTVTSLAESAFASCFSLREIRIPTGVNSIGNNLFDNCYSLGSVLWDSPIDPKAAFTAYTWDPEAQQNLPRINITNRNTLLYVDNETVTEKGWFPNLVCNNIAEQVILSDSLINRIYVNNVWMNYHHSFYAARPFKAKHISYLRSFNIDEYGNEIQSGRGEAGGWQTIALPFGVQKFEHEEKGELAPFRSNAAQNEALPFWLRKLNGAETGETKYTNETVLEANCPYIIAMPNHESYEDKYNITGVVTFSATSEDGIDIAATPATMNRGQAQRYDLVSAYQTIQQADTVYAINSNVTWQNGKEYKPGTLFVRNSRTVRPFEAYAVSKEVAAHAPLFYSITGGDGEITGWENLLLKEKEKPLQAYSLNGILYITGNSDRNIFLYDTAGQIVRISEIKKGETITINDLPAGIYILEENKVIIR